MMEMTEIDSDGTIYWSISHWGLTPVGVYDDQGNRWIGCYTEANAMAQG